MFMHLFRNICKTPISALPLPTSPGLDAAISQSLGTCAATCCAQCVALEETVAFCFTGVNTEPFVSNSLEVQSLMQSLSLDYCVR